MRVRPVASTTRAAEMRAPAHLWRRSRRAAPENHAAMLLSLSDDNLQLALQGTDVRTIGRSAQSCRDLRRAYRRALQVIWQLDDVEMANLTRALRQAACNAKLMQLCCLSYCRRATCSVRMRLICSLLPAASFARLA